MVNTILSLQRLLRSGCSFWMYKIVLFCMSRSCRIFVLFFAHSLIESDYNSTCLDSTLKFCCVNFVEFMRLEVYNILYIYEYVIHFISVYTLSSHRHTFLMGSNYLKFDINWKIHHL